MRPVHSLRLALVLSTLAFTGAGAVEVFPLGEIRPGLKGTALTVFEGDSISSFPVEIVDRISGRGAYDLVLVRGDEALQARGGVSQGMSGSPVYVDGRWLGAIAFTYAFSREPLALVTPAAAMLSLADRPWTGPDALHGSLRELPFLGGDDAQPTRLPPGPEGEALRLSVGGLDPSALARLERGLSGQGLALLPLGISTGNAGTAAGVASKLEPGAAIAAQLLSGPVSVASIGTVSHVDGDRVWAFGHPFLEEGPLALPLASVRVHAVMPSLNTSFKIASVGQPVGTLLQDGRAGVYGRLGPAPAMLPLRLELDAEGRPSRSAEFELARHPRLAPLLGRIALQGWAQGILSSRDEGGLHLGLTLRLGEPAVAAGSLLELSEGFAGEGSLAAAGAWFQSVLEVLFQNPGGTLPVDSLALSLAWREDADPLELLDLAVDRPAIRAGESWALRVRLREGDRKPFLLSWPFAGESGKLASGRALPPGDYRLHVADGRSFHSWDAQRQPELYRFRDHASLLELLARLELRSDWLLWLEGPGADPILGGRELALPTWYRELLPAPARGQKEKPRRLLSVQRVRLPGTIEARGHQSIPVTILPQPARSVR